MRKIISSALAATMALSMASVAFAADKDYTISAAYFHEKSDKVIVDGADAVPNGKIGYGKSAYYTISYEAATGGSLLLTDYDLAKNVKVKPQWTQNGDLVEKVSVVKKRIGATDGYSYTIAIQTKDKDTTSNTEIAGKIEVSVKSGYKVGAGSVAATGTKVTINPFITVGYDYATVAAATDSDFTLTDSDEIYQFASTGVVGGGADASKFVETEEATIDLYGAAGTFVVDTKGQGKILLSNTVKYNEGLEAIYPDANYVYINGNGKSFNKTGTMTLTAEEGNFLYQVKNGKLVKMNVEYDDVEEGFVFKTRTLGTYVISETELDLDAQNVVETPAEGEGEVEAEPTAPINPGTGAIA